MRHAMSKDKPPVAATLTHEEWTLINNALNEVCNGLNWTDEEVQTRLGYSRDKVRKLLTKVAAAGGK